MSEKRGVLKDKSFAFAIRVVKLYRYLCDTKKEYVLSKQLLRCGTAIGANVREASNAESTLDFIHKLAIAQKEADEAFYWLELLLSIELTTKKEFNSLYFDASELLKMIRSSILTVKRKRATHNS